MTYEIKPMPPPPRRPGRPPTNRHDVTTTLRDPDALARAFGMPAPTVLRYLGERLAEDPSPQAAADIVRTLLLPRREGPRPRRNDRRPL